MSKQAEKIKQVARMVGNQRKQAPKLRRTLEQVEASKFELPRSLTTDGPVTIYYVFDYYSHSVLGYSLHTDKQDITTSIIKSYQHAISNNLINKNGRNIKQAWQMNGEFNTFIIDASPEYQSRDCLGCIEDLKVNIQVTDSRMSSYMNSFIDALSYQLLQIVMGVQVGEPHGEFRNKVIQKQEPITVEQFANKLTKWIIDEYHKQPQSELNGKSPQKMWNESMK